MIFKRNQKAQRQLARIAVPTINGAEISAIYHGERMGGDFYDFLRVAPHLVLFGLLDVAGRRQENQPIVAAAQGTFREFGQSLFSRDDINESDAMIELSLHLNHAIMQAAHAVRSCPAFIGCYNEQIGTICYSNAGHTPALLRDQAGVTLLPATGLPLGLFSHVTHDAPTVALPPGGCLLLVSRGVTEATCDRGEFGFDRVREDLERARFETAEQVCGDLLRQLDEFTCRAVTNNDVTALALLRAQASQASVTD